MNTLIIYRWIVVLYLASVYLAHPAPTLAVLRTAENKVVLSWAGITNPYILYGSSTDLTASWNPLLVVSSPGAFTLESTNQAQLFALRPISGGASVNATILNSPGTPTVIVQSLSGNRIKISWGSDAVGYNLYSAPSSDPTNFVLFSSITRAGSITMVKDTLHDLFVLRRSTDATPIFPGYALYVFSSNTNLLDPQDIHLIANPQGGISWHISPKANVGGETTITVFAENLTNGTMQRLFFQSP